MERLTTTSKEGGLAFTFDLDVTCRESEIRKIEKLGNKLKAYEDAEEQGLLLRLPVPIGSTVYVIESECEGDIYDCSHCCEQCACLNTFVAEVKFDAEWIYGIGKVVFLTREEAESALAEKGE